MRIVKISVDGLEQVTAEPFRLGDSRLCWRITHGEWGRGRWQVHLPLHRGDFSSPVDWRGEYPLEGINVKLVPIQDKKDSRGNQLYILRKGEEDGKWLVLWNLSPGFRGGASYEIEGSAREIARGEEAQGEAGRMGGAPCPIVLVEGPCALHWERKGRLYGEPAKWSAVFDGTNWIIGPAEDVALEAHLDT